MASCLLLGWGDLLCFRALINKLPRGWRTGAAACLEGLVNRCSLASHLLSPFSLQPAFKGLTFTDLPLCLQLNIMQRLSDGRDLVSLGQAAPDLHVLSEDRLLWKKLCQYHFSERQVGKAQRAFLPPSSVPHPKLPWCPAQA